MPIIIDKEAGLITLQTRSTEYQMKVDRQGMLLHTYYGGPIGGSDMSSAIFLHDRGFSGNLGGDDTEDRTLSPDLLPQEYSCFGTGDYRVSALCAEHISGAKACALRVDRYWTEPGKYALEGLPAVYAAESEAESLFVRMKDPYAGMAVELQYSVLESLDVITRSVKIMNTGRTKILLQKAVRVHPGDTPETLQRRVMEQAEWKLLPRAVELVSKEIVSQRN